MYIDPFTRRKFNCATPTSCKIIPQNAMPLDPDNDVHFVLTNKTVLRATLTAFEPTQLQSALSPNTFTAQEAGMLN